MSFLSKILGRGSKPKPSLKKQERDPARYEFERETARSENSKDRLKLARDPKTHLEILYYLAEDQDTKVRRAVASNPSTPLQVSDVLARDSDVDVKIALIERLAALLPDLSQDQYAHLYAFAAQALGILALDEVLKVRLALSSALRDELYAPPEVVSQLARDLEREVSEPILVLCTSVPDEVLIDILIQHPEDWVIEAIAGRKDIPEDIAEAVVETKSVRGGRRLIENSTAKLTDLAIDTIINQAKETPEWHQPLALQTHLPSRVIRDIISFVDESIQKLIFKRADVDDLTRNDLMDTISRRMTFLVDKKGGRITPEEKVALLDQSGDLNDDAVCDALALREYEVVYQILAVKSGLPVVVAKKMVQTQSAKAVTSLVWKADMEMRTALEIQKAMAKIQPRELIYPRNGNEFPLSHDDMSWQVDFFSED